MKRDYFSFLASVLAVSASSTSADAAHSSGAKHLRFRQLTDDGSSPQDSCLKQDSATDVTVTKVANSASCGSHSYVYKVCVKAGTGLGNPKAPQGLSHFCLPKENDKCFADQGFTQDDWTKYEEIGESVKEFCTYATPGETVVWALKDGTTCDTTGFSEQTIASGGTADATVSCGVHADFPGISSTFCAGAGNEDTECVWSVTVPEFAAEDDVGSDSENNNNETAENSNTTEDNNNTPDSEQEEPSDSGSNNETTEGSNTQVNENTSGSEQEQSDTTLEATTTGSGGGYGDPHLKTWRGHLYDFHGECDLVLVHSKNFAHGRGLDLHIRTTIRDGTWSFISGAALRIGNDVFELVNDGKYYFNGETTDKLPHRIGGFPFRHKQIGQGHKFYVDLRGEGTILLKAYTEFLAISMKNADGDLFHDSVGLMGDFETGNMVGRDGKTIFQEDPEGFGLEWQVTDTDAQLFKELKGPQFPQKCILPAPLKVGRRRLEESMVSRADAEKACSEWKEDKETCIYDVMSTGDLGMAQAGAF